MGDSYTNLLAHIIFSTKNRETFLLPPFDATIHQFMAGVLRERRCTVIAIGGHIDHVHMLIGVPPTLAISNLVRDVKSITSGWAREHHGRREFGWQDGYAAFSVSQSVAAKVKTYIENQAAHHAKSSFLDEYKSWVRLNNLTYFETD